MNKEKSMILFLLCGIFLTVLLVSGSTFAYLSWQTGSESETLVTFTLEENFSCAVDGGGNITSDDIELAPASCTDTTHAIKRKIEVIPTIKGDVTVSMDLWLKINSIGTGLSNSHNFRYALTTNISTCAVDAGGVIVSGTFYGKNAGDQIMILKDAFEANNTHTYYLYIWLDEAEIDISTIGEPFDFELGGVCTDTPPDTFSIVYSETDTSLRFFKDANETIEVGDTITTGEGTEIVATNVYEMNENNAYRDIANLPWHSIKENITKVVIEDEIAPVSIHGWFQNLEYTEEMDVTKLNTSNILSLNYAFSNVGLNVAGEVKITGLDNWNTSNVKDMARIFYSVGYNSSSCNIGDLSEWNVSNVTNMQEMFFGVCRTATSDFDIGNLDNWNTSNVIDMNGMFRGTGRTAPKWNIGNLDNWDVSNVTDMSEMFVVYNDTGNVASDWSIGDLSNWDVSNVTNMSAMFYKTGNNVETFDIGDLSNWDVSNVTDMSYMFASAGNSATTFDIGNLDNWDVSNVTNMSGMFTYTATNATTWNIGNLDNWDVSNVTTMEVMFNHSGKSATTFDIGNLDNWDVSNVTAMNAMFTMTGYNSTTFNIGDLSNWDVSNVTDMGNMFEQTGACATDFDIGDLSVWDTSSATDMFEMFVGAGTSSNYTLDLRGWNVQNVTVHDNFSSSNVIAPIWVN